MNRRAARLLARFGALLIGVTYVTGAARAAEPRFDDQVRDAFFSGFAGVADDLRRGMAICEAALAVDPDRADALVWHGAGLFFMAGTAFRDGDRDRGLRLQSQGLSEMDRAVALAPDRTATRVPRGAALMGAARHVANPAIATPWLRTAMTDYEAVVAFQAADWLAMSEQDRGELLGALAEGWDRLGERTKSQTYLERIVAELPRSPYGVRATAWLADGRRPDRMTCLGCHKSPAN